MQPPARGSRRLFRLSAADAERDVRDEVAFHIDALTEELIRDGVDPTRALQIATSRFGDVTRISQTLHQLSRDGARQLQRKEWWSMLWQDIRYAVRQLRHAPLFTAIAMLTLALGIGANTAIFSVVYSVLLRPLPFAHAERLLDIRQGTEDANASRVVPYGNFAVWEQESRLFEALGGYDWTSLTLTGSGEPQRLRGNRASAGFWRAEFVPPAVGRYYDHDADQPGAPHVVVLSYALWVSTFGADRSVVGRSILLDGQPYQVVAVAARDYTLAATGPSFWIPLVLTPQDRASFGDHELTVVGLVRAGTTSSAAVAELSAIDTRLAKDHPGNGYNGRIVARPLLTVVAGTARTQYLILLGAVALVLLIACGNVANLLLARATSRQGEIALRSALGATRGRIVSQLLVESLLLAGGGAALGLAIGALGIRFMVTMTPPGVARLDQASLNLPVLCFTLALGLLSGIVFGLVPALRVSHADMQTTLRKAGRDMQAGARDRMRGALIIAEIAIALVLLTGAGLLLRSADRIGRVPLGFVPDQIVTARIGLPPSRYGNDTLLRQGYDRIVAEVRSVPGVISAGMISRLPLASAGADCGVSDADKPAGNGAQFSADFRSVTPGYFETMHVPLIAGRGFTAADQPGSPQVAVITESLARELFGTSNAIGRRVIHCIGTGDGRNNPLAREVVGVVADVRANGRAQPASDQVYYPYTQFSEGSMSLVVRTALPPSAVVGDVKRAVNRVDNQLAVANVATMNDIVAWSSASSRFTTLLLLALGVTGLLLATIGIYGVVSYFVNQRTRELGIRIALGATAIEVQRLVVRQGLMVAVAGVLVGEVAAWIASRLLQGFVFGVGVHDPITFAAVAVLLLVIAVSASAIPARRATRADPVQALRS